MPTCAALTLLCMPELAAIYLVGLFFCLVLTLVYNLLRVRRRNSPEYVQLRANLQRSGLYWSENEDRVVPYTPEREAEDHEKLKKSTALVGSILSLLSWAGAFFLMIIMISERYIARSRRERAIFNSKIAREDLSADRTTSVLAEIGLAP